MEKIRKYVQRWYDLAQMRQRIIDGTATEYEALSALTGLPQEAFPFIEKCQKEDVLKARISNWWNNMQQTERPAQMTMAQFRTLFGEESIGSWQLGEALRALNWTSSRRRWKESGSRCRIWIPPKDKD